MHAYTTNAAISNASRKHAVASGGLPGGAIQLVR